MIDDNIKSFFDLVNNDLPSQETGRGFYLKADNSEKSIIDNAKIIYSEATETNFNIRVEREQDGFNLYLDMQAFNNHLIYKKEAIFESDFCIIKFKNGQYYFYNHQENDCLPKSIENSLYYLKLKTLFKDRIADVNDGNDTFHLFTTDKGSFTLKSKSDIPLIEEHLSTKEIYTKVLDIVNNTDAFKTKILKNIIINHVPRSENDNYFSFLENANNIILETENDYDHYLRKFTFESLNNEAKKAASDYFKKINETLNKAMTQVIGIPVSISATLIALNKVSNCNRVIVLLLFLIYSCFSYRFYRLFLKEFEYYNDLLKKDINTIKRDSALKHDYIDETTKNVIYKSDYSICISRIITYLFIVFILISLCLILNEIFPNLGPFLMTFFIS